MIFERLPLFVKKILFYFASWKVNIDRYKGNYFKYLDYFNNWSNKKQLNFDAPEIKVLYGEIYNNLSDYPIINKEILKEKIEKTDFYKNVKKDGVMHTSGSTGAALTVPYTKDFLRYKYASSWFFREVNGLNRTVPNCNFTGRVLFDLDKEKKPYWLWGSPNSQLLFSQYHLSVKTISDYIDAMEHYKIKWVHGYPSVVSYFSQLVEDCGLTHRLHNMNILGISVSSESLSQNQKVLIERVFNAKVLNFYGQAESVVDIFECEEGQLHINELFSEVELIPYENDIYHLVGTQLNNKSFPLIRYDTGDLVEYKGRQNCKCGRKGRIVEKIIGRVDDVIVLRDGRKIGRIDHLFKGSVNVVEAQVVQYQKGQGVFKIVKNKFYAKGDEENICNEIRNKLGHDFDYRIEYVDFIKKSKNGKLKQVISYVQ